MGTPRIKLDFDTLYGKAFKVTDPEGDPSREGFSTVTYVNGAVFNQWKERPQFKELVRQKLNEPDFLADYKYQQIVDSAKELGLLPALKRGSTMAFDTFDASDLAKVARVLDESDLPNSDPDLQDIVGDPDDTRTSTFVQFKPIDGGRQIPNPLSPLQGDEIFFAYMIPGAVFQAHDGSQWNILGYAGTQLVQIENRWYPRLQGEVSVNDVRRSIEQWIEPIQQYVPAPPVGVEYGVTPVRIVEGSTNSGHPDELAMAEGVTRAGSGGW